MNPDHPTQLIKNLRASAEQKLILFGTSLSYHLAPHLRDALFSRYGHLVTVVNAGLSGKASRTALDLLESRVLSHRPDTVWLEFAINDAYSYVEYGDDTRDKGIDAAESRANLESLIDGIEAALPSCEITLLIMNSVFDRKPATGGAEGAGLGASGRPQLAIFHQNYRAVAAARHLKVIDATTLWDALAADERTRDTTLLSLIPDGVHPTPRALREQLVPFLLDEIGA